MPDTIWTWLARAPERDDLTLASTQRVGAEQGGSPRVRRASIAGSAAASEQLRPLSN
ncbi:MAG TPA: hypothetical protein VFK04_19785 [Gemmatimonadaceae bacterium]|nr:hypothetical protein [Gemmatimonadaceae bacterium]